jgi:putative ABC transport system permease protein
MMGAERAAKVEPRKVPDGRSVIRSMFWRVLRRSVFANRGRLSVILLALGAGSAVTAALLNLQIDAKRRVAVEFRAFGANVTIAPRAAEVSGTMADSISDDIPSATAAGPISKVALLSAVADVTPIYGDSESRKVSEAGPTVKVVVNGQTTGDRVFTDVFPSRRVFQAERVYLDVNDCQVGGRVAQRLGVRDYRQMRLKIGNSFDYCFAESIHDFGTALDDQAFAPLDVIQRLTGKVGQISLIELRVPGTPSQVDQTVDLLRQKLPSVDVRPIRQFTEGEARLYGKISGILTATVAVVLVLTSLCVMAAMTNIAAERKNDVGLMKAIGGSVRRILRIFLAEAALLGLVGGLFGAAAGIVLSIGLGKAVFGVAAQPRLIVYPVSVALTVIVAILASYPLRRLIHIRPASVFRGEE